MRKKVSRIELALNGEHFYNEKTEELVHPEELFCRPILIEPETINPNYIQKVAEQKAPKGADYYMILPGLTGEQLIQYYKERKD
jgi:hypothetical protein